MELDMAEFHTDGSAVWVIFRYNREMAGQVPPKHPTSTRQVSDKYPTSTPQVEALVGIIGIRLCSVKELMEQMQLNDRKNFLNSYLNPALEAGLVEPLYPNQPNHPKQKYRLTGRGKSLLQDDGKTN